MKQGAACVLKFIRRQDGIIIQPVSTRYSVTSCRIGVADNTIAGNELHIETAIKI
jgi:hypothetical protein